MIAAPLDAGQDGTIPFESHQNGLKAAVHGKELRGLTFHNSRSAPVIGMGVPIASERGVCEDRYSLTYHDMTTTFSIAPIILTSARAAAGMTSRARRPEYRYPAG